jgi:flagellar motor switch protein FliG
MRRSPKKVDGKFAKASLPSLRGLTGTEVAVLVQDEPLSCIALVLAAVPEVVAAQAIKHMHKRNSQDLSDILTRIVALGDVSWEDMQDLDQALQQKRQSLLQGAATVGGKAFVEQVLQSHPELEALRLPTKPR